MLINKTDIAAKRQISKSVSDAKINPFIEDAELLDLKPLLGELFYSKIVQNPNDFADLLGPKDYTFNDFQLRSPGLKRVLIDFAYARYVMHGSQTDTPFGMVQKETQDSSPVSRTDKKENYKLHQQTAMQYWGEVVNYLNRHSDLYPLWGKSNCSTKRFFKFNHIGK